MKLVNPNSDTLALPDRKSGSVGSRRGQLVGGCGHGAWPRLQRASATYLVGAPAPCVREHGRPGAPPLACCYVVQASGCAAVTGSHVDERVVPRPFGAVTLPCAEARPCSGWGHPVRPLRGPVAVWVPAGPQLGQLSSPWVPSPAPPCSPRRRLALSLCASVWTQTHYSGIGPSDWTRCFEAL